MDIEVYGNIKEGLTKFFDKLELSKSYKPTICGVSPSTPVYPLIKVQEVRNVPYDKHDAPIETIASLGYKVDIYAQQKAGILNQTVARVLAKNCNDFMTKYVGLKQVSWNEIDNETDTESRKLYHIMLMYSGKYFENKLQFI